MSDTNQPRPSIRIGSSTAQRRIHEEETDPSSSPLTTDPAPVPPSSVEASALSEATLPEGSIPKEDSSLPEDSIPSEGRSSSLVSYDDEDAEDSEAPPSSSSLRVSEVSSSPLPQRSSEVPTSSPRPESEVPSSNQPPSVSTVKRVSQNPAVPASGSPLTSTTVSGVDNLTVSPPHAIDPAHSTLNFPSYLSEEQRKRYEQIFSDLIDYVEPATEFSTTQSSAPPQESRTGDDFQHCREQRMGELRRRLDWAIQAPSRFSSTEQTPLDPSFHASSSVHDHGASR
ncbi:hypothetical protein P9112_012639 [Eukaryota sp. TZLM1-RC]